MQAVHEWQRGSRVTREEWAQSQYRRGLAVSVAMRRQYQRAETRGILCVHPWMCRPRATPKGFKNLCIFYNNLNIKIKLFMARDVL